MDMIPDMSGISNLEPLKKAIRESFPTINPNWPIVLDDKFDLTYFEDRKMVFYQVTEEFQKFDLKIRRFRSRFHVSGIIEETSPSDMVSFIRINVPLKICHKKSNTTEMLELYSHLRDTVAHMRAELAHVHMDLAELKEMTKHGLGLTMGTESYITYPQYNQSENELQSL